MVNTQMETKGSKGSFNSQHDPPHPTVSTQDDSLIGTLISVFGVGLFIVLSWLAVFLLYLSRG